MENFEICPREIIAYIIISTNLKIISFSETKPTTPQLKCIMCVYACIDGSYIYIYIYTIFVLLYEKSRGCKKWLKSTVTLKSIPPQPAARAVAGARPYSLVQSIGDGSLFRRVDIKLRSEQRTFVLVSLGLARCVRTWTRDNCLG